MVMVLGVLVALGGAGVATVRTRGAEHRGALSHHLDASVAIVSALLAQAGALLHARHLAARVVTGLACGRAVLASFSASFHLVFVHGPWLARCR